MGWTLVLVFLGFALAGGIITYPIAFLLGRRAQLQRTEVLWNHIDAVHQSLNHKSYIVLRPNISANRRAR